jgi:hypothetical protein
MTLSPKSQCRENRIQSTAGQMFLNMGHVPSTRYLTFWWALHLAMRQKCVGLSVPYCCDETSCVLSINGRQNCPYNLLRNMPWMHKGQWQLKIPQLWSFSLVAVSGRINSSVLLSWREDIPVSVGMYRYLTLSTGIYRYLPVYNGGY